MVAILPLVLALTAASQAAPTDSLPRGTVVGTVLDAASGLALAGATVVLEAYDGVLPAGNGSGMWQAGRVVRTNEYGAYQFVRLSPGRYRLQIRRIGYHPTTLELDLAAADQLRVSVGLRVQPVLLEPDTVTGIPRPFVRTVAMRHDDGLTRRAIERARQRDFIATDARLLTSDDLLEAVTLGETDLLRALHQIPGVGTRDDFTAELWTRGAAWSQTRVLFDGVPLFNPVHTAGVFSGIHPDAVGVAAFHPGARSAALGEGAAGILEITSRRGGPGFHGTADVSPISARLALEGGGDRTGWMVAGRRSWVDVLTRVTADSASRIPYAFHDLVGRVDVGVGTFAAIEASGLLERDVLRGDVPDVLTGNTGHWGNAAGQVTGRVVVAGLMLRPSVGRSDFDADVELTSLLELGSSGDLVPTSTPTRNALRWSVARLAVEPLVAGDVVWSAGVERVWQEQAYVGPFPRPYPVAIVTDTLRMASRLDRAGVWADVRVGRGPWSLQGGLRWDGAVRVPAPRMGLSPHVVLRARPVADLYASLAWNRSYQFAQALAPAGPPIGPNLALSDVWLLSGDTIPAPRADLVTLGIEGWLGGAWLGQVHVYRRVTSGVALPDPRPGPVSAARPVFVTAENTAEGLEVGVRRLVGRWTMALSYARGRSTMEAFGLAFPSTQDQRHVINGTALMRLGRAVRVGGALTAASGAPYTRFLVTSIACDTLLAGCAGGLDTLFAAQSLDAPNAERGPVRVALDAFGEWEQPLGAWRVSVFAQVRNVLNRRNAVTYAGSRSGCTAPGPDERDAGDGVCDRFDRGLPLLPVLGVRVAF